MKQKFILSLLAMFSAQGMMLAQTLCTPTVETGELNKGVSVTTSIGTLYDAGSLMNRLTVNAQNFNLAEFNSSLTATEDAALLEETDATELENTVELSTPTDIDDIPIAVLVDNEKMYNLMGTLVEPTYIGIVVVRGTKYYKRQAYY